MIKYFLKKVSESLFGLSRCWRNQMSISSTFYAQLLRAQIPKAYKFSQVVNFGKARKTRSDPNFWKTAISETRSDPNFRKKLEHLVPTRKKFGNFESEQVFGQYWTIFDYKNGHF